MGLQGLSVNFPSGTPALRLVAETAERRGGLPINVVQFGENGLGIAFASFPNGLVTIFLQGNSICVIDYSQTAPTLFRLLWETLVHLGGAGPASNAKPLNLPLTKATIRRGAFIVHFNSAVFFVLLLALFTAIVWAVVRAA